MHAVLGRGFGQRRGRIERRRHAPRARIGFRKADEIGALARGALDRAHRVGDVALVLAGRMRDRLHDGDAEGHGRAPWRRSALFGALYLRRIEAAPLRQVKARNLLPPPAGGRSRAQRRGWGQVRCLRRAHRDAAHPTRTPAARAPPPAGEGENKSPPFSRCVFASEACHATARKPFPRPPPTKEGRRSAEKRIVRGRIDGCGARHVGECCHSPALRARSPFGAPPRYSPVGLRRPAQLQAMLPGTRVGRALPALAYPSPGTAPPAPAVVPA